MCIVNDYIRISYAIPAPTVWRFVNLIYPHSTPNPRFPLLSMISLCHGNGINLNRYNDLNICVHIYEISIRFVQRIDSLQVNRINCMLGKNELIMIV